MAFKDKFRQLRLEKGLKQDDIAKVLRYKSTSYVSDIELGKFIPQPDKLEKLAKAFGISKEYLEDLILEDRLENLGITDPGFTMMFKEVPRMTREEKQSLLRAYASVMRARQNKRGKK